MGARGPLPKRRALTSADGGRIRRLPVGERAAWRQLVADNPLLTPADASLVDVLLQATMLARWSYEVMAQPGPEGQAHTLLERDTAHGDGQEMRRHPLWMAWRMAADMVVKASGQLGASPMARARMPEPEEQDVSIAELLFAEASASNE